MVMTGIDFDYQQYRREAGLCEVWPHTSEPIRDWCNKALGFGRIGQAISQEVAHIIGGPGRKHYHANVIRANRIVHNWCDSHGKAGRVLLMYSKWKLGEHDFALWGRLFTGCNNVAGYCGTDDTVRQCAEWGIAGLRCELLAAAEMTAGR